jgi:hypothetical protein
MDPLADATGGMTPEMQKMIVDMLRKQQADSGLNEAALDTLTPEQRAEQYFDYEGTGEAIDDRSELSKAGLAQGMAGTDMVTAGNQTVAATDLSALGSVLQSGVGAYGMRKAREEKTANSAREAKASETLANAYSKNRELEAEQKRRALAQATPSDVTLDQIMGTR